MILGTNLKRKINHYLKENLGMYDYRKGWLKGDCPYCGEHKFGVNLGMNRTNCFKCESHPRPIDLIMEIEGLNSMPELLSLLQLFEGIDYVEQEVKALELKSEVTLPEGYRNIKRGDSIIAKAARHFVKKRGFSIDKVSRLGWGYCTKGKYAGYLIMPFYIANRLVYYNARIFMGPGAKFNNPLIEEFGLGKSMLIYNRDALEIYNKVYLFESVTNSVTMGYNAIATGGKKVSNYQIDKIIKSPCEKLVIGLDDDAIDDAIDLALKISPYKKVKILFFPPGKDANDLGRKETLKLEFRTRYMRYKEVLSLKLNLQN